MSYIYRHVEVVRVVDGDTVRLDVDMGNCIWWTENFRLMGIDTPERGKPGFTEATEQLKELLGSGIARIETFKPDKYGRWLADIYVNSDDGVLLVNKAMGIEGYAAEYDGGAR